MSDIAIKVRGLGKKYYIGEKLPQRSLAGSIKNAAGFPWKVAKSLISGKAIDQREEFWALKDVSFDVKQGEVLGIIGRNGAGKSTLLKILSRITTPTTGEVELFGRVGCLLEVGTGFHPELTGRENIFLNGSLLGMTNVEIKQRFDEIVDFSGGERFLDTPVKFYSSGMYTRLAFSVAAHLNPEILIVDEVLAVGDAEFQKKCLGKMDDIAKSGRTILFVSHNMAAISKLCKTCILLEDGRMINFDLTEKTKELYLSRIIDSSSLSKQQEKNSGQIRLTDVKTSIENNGISVMLNYTGKENIKPIFYLGFYNSNNTMVLFLDSGHSPIANMVAKQNGTIKIFIPQTDYCFAAGLYRINTAIIVDGEWVYHIEDSCVLEIIKKEFHNYMNSPFAEGIINSNAQWTQH